MHFHQAFIFSDAAGYPRRAARLRSVCEAAGVPFVHVSPTDRIVEGATPVAFPESWLPAPRETDTPGRREWSRCHLYAVLGAQLLPPADHYWLVEADVDGPSETWARLFSQTADRPEDGLWSRMYPKADSPEHIAFNSGQPAWVDTSTLGCIMRVSARGLRVWEETAEETREVFTEYVTASTLTRAGFAVGKINQDQQPGFYHTGTLCFNPGRTDFDPCRSSNLLRHPVKRDDPSA